MSASRARALATAFARVARITIDVTHAPSTRPTTLASASSRPTTLARPALALASRARGFSASARDGDAPDAPARVMERERDVDDREASVRRSYERLFERFERAPSKRKRFLLNLALKGQVSAELEESGDGEGDGGGFRKRALQTRVIDVNRTNKVTKGGDLTNFTAMVVVGNGDGVIGFGTGKAAEVGLAIDKAYRKAARSLMYVKRFEDHTIFHAVKAKYCKTLAILMPAASGYGIVANDTVEAICALAGIKNIKAKIHGSHHPHNTVRAVFAALETVESPEDVARRTGSHIYRV